MITRPLDLASKMRPEPRSFDWLFLVNVGLIGLFFSLFGSRFVLAPGLRASFELPALAGANANAQIVTHAISFSDSKQAVTADGIRSLANLGEWFKAQARTEQSPSLLIQADASTSLKNLTDVVSLAEAAGFRVHLAMREPHPGSSAPAKP